LKRAFQSTMRALVEELRHVDGGASIRLSGTLNEIAA
jgi:hypothetical protein